MDDPNNPTMHWWQALDEQGQRIMLRCREKAGVPAAYPGSTKMTVIADLADFLDRIEPYVDWDSIPPDVDFTPGTEQGE